MATITIEDKRTLGELIAKGHARFGKVAPRHPYYEDDEGGGDTGASDLRFETHPLLKDLPIGAASDLTISIPDHENITELAQARAEESCPELRIQPAMQEALRHAFLVTPSAH